MARESIERKLPYDINAEAAVLCAMMIDTYSVNWAIGIIKEEYFYRSAHKIIFASMLELSRDNIEIDTITLIDRLQRNKMLDKVGGKMYIAELSDVVLSGSNLEYHANIIINKALLRSLITSSNKIIETAYLAEKPVSEIVDEAESIIFEIAERPNARGLVKVSDVIPDTIITIENVAKTKSGVQGVPTGFDELNRKTGGFRPGQLIVLAARPAMGKTSFALNIASNAAINNDMKVAIFTMEMATEELLMRMLAANAEVPMDDILKGFGMNNMKMQAISQAAAIMAEKDIYIDDSGANTALEIRAKSRRLKAQLNGLDLIIIDYLQLMGSSGRARENRQQEISEISRSLKILAKELQCPVMALSQLNRGLESRPNKRPLLSDLRESGAIEQDADMVMFIYRDEIYNKEKSDKLGIAEIIIGKNRHGPVGTIDLKFIPHLTKFVKNENQNYEPDF